MMLEKRRKKPNRRLRIEKYNRGIRRRSVRRRNHKKDRRSGDECKGF